MKQSPLSDEFFAIDGVFSDIDHLAEVARAWELDFYQMGRGEFEGRLFQMGNGEFQLGEARFSRSLEQHGATAAAIGASVRLISTDRAVQSEGIVVAVGSSDLLSIAEAGLVAVPPEHAAAIATAAAEGTLIVLVAP